MSIVVSATIVTDSAEQAMAATLKLVDASSALIADGINVNVSMSVVDDDEDETEVTGADTGAGQGVSKSP